ncbi:dienelactone hydrolase family protein [Mucilaginibacter sp. ZT4R22]|uniref:Dienelactone hydrolase family protein n=2 Tax=Mucilaginibacter pankratovii TaxID=2772110 RepID=A0ABR7WM15_9SPHI|nr:dienelactone hydrolase family protein [Mucilaginibacter pankratovii]
MPKTKPDTRFAALLFLLIMNAAVAFGQAENYPLPDKVARDFKDLLNRPMVDPKPRFGNVSMDTIQVDTGSIYTEANERMPVLIYKPVIAGQTRFPAAIFLHGTGGTKDQGNIKAIFIKLAKLGIMGVAIDARYHGQRIPGGAHGSKEYTEAAYQAFKTNDQTHHAYPFLYDTSYDLWRLVDYLVTRPDVKADRIGMGGISMGGVETWMAASVDIRIHAAVLGIAVQSFKWSLENNKWQDRAGTIGDAHKKAAHDLGDSTVNQANVKAVWDKILPGITGEFDCPSMIRLFAPRPLLILSKDKDTNNPYPGAQIGFVTVTDAYKARNATDKLDIVVQPNLGHVFNAKDADLTIAFFAKYLLE